MNLEDGADRLSRNVGTEPQHKLYNIPEEGRSHLHRGKSLKFGKTESVSCAVRTDPLSKTHVSSLKG
jgi:hypothetical protein